MPTSQFMVILMLLLQFCHIFANALLFFEAHESINVLKSILKNITKTAYLKDYILASSHIVVLNCTHTFNYRTNC